MKKILNKNEVLSNKDLLKKEILAGKIFIYPTDTLYGLGTNAQIGSSVKKIFTIKKRTISPLLIVAPSMDWIFSNCKIKNDSVRNLILTKLPGPYSFILNLKSKEIVHSLVKGERNSIGVRIPKHWFSEIISESNIPFISTSVNFSGHPSCKTIGEIPFQIINRVDYIIADDKSVRGKGSKIIDLTNEKERILRK